MKKLLAFVLAFICAVSLLGCATAEHKNENQKPNTDQENLLDTKEGEFDPYIVPFFTTASSDLQANSEQIKGKLDMSGNSSFCISDNGAITYYRYEDNEQVPMQMTDDEASSLAIEYLNELGLLPDDDYRTYVKRVFRYLRDPATGEPTQEVTIWIDVFIYRVFNGVDVVSDHDDGILLSFDAQGIFSLEYLWRNIETTKLAEDSQPISSGDAYQIYLDQWDSIHGVCCEPCENPEMFKAYIQINDESRPCWVIAENKMYTGAWFIDMLTGEVLYVV